MQLAIIELSGGDKETLLRYVKGAKVDYRDILARRQSAPLAGAAGNKLQDAARGVSGKLAEK